MAHKLHSRALFTSYHHLSTAMTSLRLLRRYMCTLYGLMAMVCIRSCDNYVTTTLYTRRRPLLLRTWPHPRTCLPARHGLDTRLVMDIHHFAQFITRRFVDIRMPQPLIGIQLNSGIEHSPVRLWMARVIVQ